MPMLPEINPLTLLKLNQSNSARKQRTADKAHRKQEAAAHRQPRRPQRALHAREIRRVRPYSPTASLGSSFFLIGNTSLTVMAVKMRTKPRRSLSVTCSPVISTDNSTPKTDSRLSSSEA